MTLLAEAQALRTLLELTDDDNADDALLELCLRNASGVVIGYTGSTFALVAEDEVLLDGRGSTLLLLPQLPVNDVLEVVEAPGDDSETVLFSDELATPLVEWSSSGMLRRVDGGVFARRFRWYRVVYSHGLAIVDDAVRDVVLRVAARSFTNPEEVRQETIGRYSYTRDSAAAKLSEAEKASLDHLVIPEARTFRQGTA